MEYHLPAMAPPKREAAMADKITMQAIEAEIVVAKAFVIEATVALARQQSDPEGWLWHFLERMQARIDWFQKCARENGRPERAAYDAARAAIEKARGYLNRRLAVGD